MKRMCIIILGICFFLASCAAPAATSTPTIAPPTAIPPSNTPRNLMLPTWTPAPTTPPKPTRTPRNTPTPMSAPTVRGAYSPIILTRDKLIDRPTYSEQPKVTNLVSMEYDPTAWALNSYYPTDYMGYSLSYRAIYDCRLEPSVGKGVEGYEVEQYSRPIGTTTYQIARVSQAGELLYANYCTGEGEDQTCYTVSPGADHDACTQAAEAVLASYKLIPNPFFGNAVTPPNRWICQNAAGTVGSCKISYTIPLSALSYSPGGQAWAVGDDGINL